MSRVVSIRLPEEKVLQLKLLACERSLQLQEEVRWPALVRDAIEQLLAHSEEPHEVPSDALLH